MARSRQAVLIGKAAAVCALALAAAPRAGAAEAAAGAEQKPAGPRIVREPDKIVVRKRTVVDFGDATVEGELLRPEGSFLLDRRRTRFPSLLKLREDFNPELQKSADNL